jgi:hypothetical protein
MTADKLVSLLEGVRERGPRRWAARCPAHDDKLPSLSVQEIDDGTVLLHCFAGCENLNICQAIGIEFRDLFPRGRIRRVEPHERPRLPAPQALMALDHEFTVAAFIVADVLEHREISPATWERLATAVRRINSARVECCPARITP